MNTSKKNIISRVGMSAKGIVYSLIGILTALSAFGFGGQQSGSKGALTYLAKQSYGKILITLLGLGLLAYVFYRMYQAFANHNNFDGGVKEYGKRVAYFISGVVYAALAYFALSLAFLNATANSSSGKTDGYPDYMLFIIAIGIAIKAVYDFYRAYSEKFRKDIEEMQMDRSEQKLLLNAGRVGHVSRGIVLSLMSYITIKSALSSKSKVGLKTDAFAFIRDEFGSVVLGLIAIGLVGYGIYMFIKAKYPATEFSS